MIITGSAQNLQWTGQANSDWDMATANWTNTATLLADVFQPLDSVVFNDSGNSASPINLNGQLQPNSLTVSNVTSDYTFSGTIYGGYISGTTTVSKRGTGRLTLATANDYTGGTIVYAGALQLGDGFASNGSVVGAISNNATLAIANPMDQTVTNAIAGSGGLVKAGEGVLTLTGANAFTGGTIVSNGVLMVPNITALGSPTSAIAATVVSPAVLKFNVNSALTLSNAIAGSGSIVKTNANTLTLAATNTFSGGLTINLGSVYAANNNALGSGPVVIDNQLAGATAYSMLLLNNGVNISNAITVVSSSSDFSGALRVDPVNGDTNGAVFSGPITFAPGSSQRGGQFCGPLRQWKQSPARNGPNHQPDRWL